MESEVMAKDNALPRNRLLALVTLLKEARSIERDLAGRLIQHPKEKSPLKRQHEEYRQLVVRLTCELEGALASYLPRIKAIAERGSRTAMRPSGRASAASLPAGRRTPDR